MKNRVLLVINTALVNAGVPYVIMQIIRHLKDDYSFDIILGDTETGYYDEEFKSYGGQIIRTKLINYSKGKIRFVKRGFQVYKSVKEALRTSKYDVIHCHNGFESGPALMAAKKLGVPIRISHSHGTYLIKGKNIFARLYKRICMHLGIQNATHRLACSSIAGETLFLGHPFLNIYNPIDVKKYFPISKLPHEGIRLVQIGYYNQLKNQLFSLDVLKCLLSRGLKAHIDFIGYDAGSGYLEKIKEKINHNQLSAFVQFLPHDYDKAKLLASADFLMLPSKSEGFPLVAIEAQISHVFCIASDNVPPDVDLGLFKRLSISSNDASETWAKWIMEHLDYHDTVNIEKMNQLDVHAYVSKIRTVYESKTISEKNIYE